MQSIIIGSKNPHKQRKLAEIVSGYLQPVTVPDCPAFDEKGDTFQTVAEQKALLYAQRFGGLAISTDGGAVIPALTKEEWEPIHTRRFAGNDQERIEKLLELMQNKEDRLVQWFEAVAIADREKVLFSTTAQAMDGVIDKAFNLTFYQEGIWLCSITSFPQFGGKNFFELSSDEQAQTEDSWSELKKRVSDFFASYLHKI